MKSQCHQYYYSNQHRAFSIPINPLNTRKSIHSLRSVSRTTMETLPIKNEGVAANEHPNLGSIVSPNGHSVTNKRQLDCNAVTPSSKPTTKCKTDMNLRQADKTSVTLDLGHPGTHHLYRNCYLLVVKVPVARDTGWRSMDVTCSMLHIFGWSSDTVTVGAFADMDLLPDFNGVAAYPGLPSPQKIRPKKRPSCHTFQTLLRIYRDNLMPCLLSWLTISISTKFSGRQHSKFGHTPSNCRQTKPILTTSHPRHFETQKSYPNNLEGKNLTWPRLLMQACLSWRIICMIDCWPLSKINQLASTRTQISWSIDVVSILLRSPPHQQLKTRPISHHPLGTHSHSRNRSHPNHLVLRPISNHPLMILHTFKIRSHPSISNNGSLTHSTTMKSPCEYAECLT
jgi:hypothetical protein